MNEAGFRAPQVRELAGISSRQLEYWTTSGGVRPSLAEGHGPGSCRLYSFEDVMVLAVIGRLLSSGLTLQAAKHAAPQLRGWSPDELCSAALVIHDDRVVVVPVRGVADLVAQANKVTVVVPLAPIIEGIAREAAALRSRRRPPDALLTSAEAATRLGVSPTTVVRWTERGKLTGAATTPGGHRRYHPGALNHLLAHSDDTAPSREPGRADLDAASRTS